MIWLNIVLYHFGWAESDLSPGLRCYQAPLVSLETTYQLKIKT